MKVQQPYTQCMEMVGDGVVSHSLTIPTDPKMFGMLFDSMYTNKFRFISELWANALDAAGEAGFPCDIPGYVSLPTTLNPMFVVRDYGTGRPHSFITNEFLTVGYSTKDKSNKAIGKWGLGRFAGFAYTNTMTFRNFYDGMVTSFFLEWDRGDPNALPHFKQLGDAVATEEANGFEWTIGINISDFSIVTSHIDRLQAYSPRKMDVRNFTCTPISYLHRFDKWGIRSADSNSWQVIMGGIAYPVRWSQIMNNDVKVINAPIDIYVNIGDVEITGNREDLRYNKSTIKFMKKVYDTIVKEGRDYFYKDLINHDSYYEAKRKFIEVKKEPFAKLFLDECSTFWKDNPEKRLDSLRVLFSHDPTYEPKVLEKLYWISNSDRRHRGYDWNSLKQKLQFTHMKLPHYHVDPPVKFIWVNSENQVKNWKSRINHLSYNLSPTNQQYSIMVVVCTPSEKQSIFDLLGSPTEVVDVEQLENPPKERDQESTKTPVKASLVDQHGILSTVDIDIETVEGYYVNSYRDTMEIPSWKIGALITLGIIKFPVYKLPATLKELASRGKWRDLTEALPNLISEWHSHESNGALIRDVLRGYTIREALNYGLRANMFVLENVVGRIECKELATMVRLWSRYCKNINMVKVNAIHRLDLDCKEYVKKVEGVIRNIYAQFVQKYPLRSGFLEDNYATGRYSDYVEELLTIINA